MNITESALKTLGFVYQNLGDEPPYEKLIKHGIAVWDFNGQYWIVDILDQAAINTQFKTLDHLAAFFTVCGLDMTGAQ